jgi:hypothetical protein
MGIDKVSVLLGDVDRFCYVFMFSQISSLVLEKAHATADVVSLGWVTEC